MENIKISNRNQCIDIAKFIASILVITLHTHPFIEHNSNLYFVVCVVLARLAVPLFFICSGYFIGIYGILNNDKKFLHLLKKYIKIFIIWSLIYLPITFHISNRSSISLYSKICIFLQQILFLAPAFMWYLMAAIVGFIMLYFLLKLNIALKYISMIGLALYFLGCLGNSYNFLFGEKYQIYYDFFLTTRNGAFFGFPYILCGYCISKFNILKGFSFRSLLMTSLGVFVMYFCEVYLVQQHSQYNADTSMYFLLLPLVVLIFMMLLKFDNTILLKIKSKNIAIASTVIYCTQFGCIIVAKKIFGIHDSQTHLFLVSMVMTNLIALCIIKNKRLHFLMKLF